MYEIQNPTPEIQTAAFGAATRTTSTTRILNPKPAMQTPKSNIPTLGWPGATAGTQRCMEAPANALWHLWAGRKARNRKVPGSIPPTRVTRRAPIRRRILLDTELRFPVPCHGNRGSISTETVDKCGVAKRRCQGFNSLNTGGERKKTFACGSLLLPGSSKIECSCRCLWFLGFFMCGRLLNSRACA